MPYEKIIDGKLYSTEKAEKICVLDCFHNKGDFGWHSTALYRSPKGSFFLAGRGGPRSMWAQSIPGGGSQDGDGIRVVDEQEARRIAEEELSVEDYTKVFGTPEIA
jgi:hypothetical protein